MNQLCKVCGEPAAGFHFGAFTCEGCKSFFGRTYNNISAISGCKNNGDCVINKKNRTACKACRLRKCLLVGMSKSGSRYGRRSNWFKIHCLLQEQQSQQQHQHQHQQQQQQQHSTQSQLQANYEQLTNFHQQFQLRSSTAYSSSQHKSSSLNQSQQQTKTANVQNQNSIVNSFFPVQHLLNGGSRNPTNNNDISGYNCNKKDSESVDKYCQNKSEHRISESASDSGASSADPDDPDSSNHQKDCINSDSPITENEKFGNLTPNSDPIRSASEPLRGFPPFAQQLGQQHHDKSSFNAFIAFPSLHIPISSPSSSSILSSSNIATVATVNCIQDEPIDLSVKSTKRCRTTSPKPNGVDLPSKATTPLDLTLVGRSPQPTSG